MKLLLDVCCGPCSTHVINELIKDYDITLFFTNSNISPKEEYDKRLNAARNVAEITHLNLIEDKYDHQSWLDFIKGYEDEPEKGKRCALCFKFRFNRTAKYARDNGYNAFTTTLTVSPFKDHKLINEIGNEVAKKYDIAFIESNFKKNDGFKKSKDLSIKHDLYAQNYCGCEFSKRKK